MCLEIRVGKAGARPALPRNCKARFNSPSQATSRIDGAAYTFAGEGGFRSRDVSDASAAYHRGGAVTPGQFIPRSSGQHWKTGKTHRNHPSIGRVRDHAAHDRMPLRLPSRSRLMPSHLRRSCISLPRSRSRIVISSSRTWSTCATDLRAARCAPVLPRLLRRRFARMPGQCCSPRHVGRRIIPRIHRSASAIPIASTKQKPPILKLPLSLPERLSSPRRPRIRAMPSRIPFEILQMPGRQLVRVAVP